MAMLAKETANNGEFIDHYENQNMILSLASTPPMYKRRYMVRYRELVESGQRVDSDVVTERGFADAEALRRDCLQPLVLAEEGKEFTLESNGFAQAMPAVSGQVDPAGRPCRP